MYDSPQSHSGYIRRLAETAVSEESRGQSAQAIRQFLGIEGVVARLFRVPCGLEVGRLRCVCSRCRVLRGRGSAAQEFRLFGLEVVCVRSRLFRCLRFSGSLLASHAFSLPGARPLPSGTARAAGPRHASRAAERGLPATGL